MTAVPSLRDAQLALTRERILDGVASLLSQGKDLTFAAVAEASGVTERTVFRHFVNRGELERSFWAWLQERNGVSYATRTWAELKPAIRSNFRSFDQQEPLIRRMIHSPEGTAIRLGANDERAAMFLAVVDDLAPGIDADARRMAAAACQVLYSGMAWAALKDFWAMSADEAASAVQFAIEALLRGATSTTKGEP